MDVPTAEVASSGSGSSSPGAGAATWMKDEEDEEDQRMSIQDDDERFTSACPQLPKNGKPPGGSDRTTERGGGKGVQPL